MKDQKKPLRVPWWNKKPIGLGDAVSKATKAIGLKECSSCRARREKLNRAVQIGGSR